MKCWLVSPVQVTTYDVMSNTAEGTKIIPAVFKAQPTNQCVGNSRPTRLLCSRHLSYLGLMPGPIWGIPTYYRADPRLSGLTLTFFGGRNGFYWWTGIGFIGGCWLAGICEWRMAGLYGYFFVLMLYKVLLQSTYIYPVLVLVLVVMYLVVFYLQSKDRCHAITTRYENHRKPTCPTPIQYVMEPPPAALPNQRSRTYLRARENVTFGIWRDPEAFWACEVFLLSNRQHILYTSSSNLQ